jgi:hypothetical protein
MADNTSIEWTDATWNPVTGCTKVSAGCDNCYAERFSERFRGTPGPTKVTIGDLAVVTVTGFEPVSAETKPVSGRPLAQISDIENSANRDTPRDSRAFGEKRPTFSQETRLLTANPRKCRLFVE